MSSDQKRKKYADANMEGHRFGYGDSPAVLVIDFQKGMTNPDNSIGSKFDDPIEKTKRVIKAARANSIEIIHTRTIYKHPELADAGIIPKKVPGIKNWTPDRSGVEIDDRITVLEDEHIIDKQQANVFYGTELDSMLTAKNVDTVLISGCSTGGCVRATVQGTCARGYRPIIPRGTVGDRSQEQHDANIFDIQRKFADVRPLAEVIEYLRGV